jgi:two-component system, sensor histidine kinase and response regulator
MSSLLPLPFSHPVPLVLLHRLDQQLRPQSSSSDFFLSTFAHSAVVQRHLVLVTPLLNVLLVAEPIADQYQLQLSFVPAVIVAFGRSLPEAIELPTIATNDSQAQTEFTMLLLDLVMESATTAMAPKDVAVNSLVEQSQLLDQVVQTIGQSLDLSEILETAVHQVRGFLQVDRLLIHQFDIAVSTNPTVSNTASLLDGVTYESRAQPHIPSILNQMGDHWLSTASHLRAKYRSGEATANEQVQGQPELAEVIAFPAEAQVRSELTTPILVQGELWGLLIAHQCDRPRQWNESDKRFLQQIVDHLSIAIYQAKLYAKLRSQADTLEQVVNDRTQDLRDMLIAAQSANRAKAEFLATMSHELRTPLTCIIGMSSTLLRYGTSEQLPRERQQSHLQTIHDRGENLLTLINDILELSTIEAGRLIINVRPFSLTPLIRQTIAELRPRATQKSIELSFLLSPDDDRQPFQADPQRIRQILLNLLSNAIKFTPEGGRVILRLQRHPDHIVIQVEDSGIGISAENQDLIFEKFRQIDSSHQRKYEGTGLGLALTKQLINLQGGTIHVVSQLGSGSTFTVMLPEQSIINIDATKPEIQSSIYGRILLIDPIEEQANLICDCLNAADHHVVWMTDLETALYQLDATQPMIMIVNTEQLQSAQSCQDLQVARKRLPMKLMLIAAASEDRDRYRSLDVDAYLTHAVGEPELLIDQVSQLIVAS